MVYQWKRNMPVDAQKAGEHLEKLEKKHGEVTPEIVLKDAKQEKSVLHSCFEWDDKKAAEGYRLTQARFILQNLTVCVEKEGEEEPTLTRAFVNVSPVSMSGNKGSYLSITNALSDEESRKIVLRNAMSELISYKRKYEELNELQEVFMAIDHVAEKVGA